MDLVNQFVYSMVLHLLARNESYHEIGAMQQTTDCTKEQAMTQALFSLYLHCLA
jgi:hypothetical protein